MAVGFGVLAAVVARNNPNGSYRGMLPLDRTELPAFTLRSHTGDTVTSAGLRGRAVVITFLESRCTEACPVIASAIGAGMRLLSAEERKRAVALAISTHPDDDAPASVDAFLRRSDAHDEVVYLVGTEAELRPVWREFDVLSALDTGDPTLHTSPVRIYGRDGRWSSTLTAGADLTPENLRHDLLEAMTE
jgi:cytochrome oxidase Cu insertion factor (SCO1/SenC/PrrC family)